MRVSICFADNTLILIEKIVLKKASFLLSSSMLAIFPFLKDKKCLFGLEGFGSPF
jgi:hypothetical protein